MNWSVLTICIAVYFVSMNFVAMVAIILEHIRAKKDHNRPPFAVDCTDSELTRRLIERLYSLKKDMWLSYGHQLNSWEFPIEFYDLIPYWWNIEVKGCMDRRYKLIHPVTKIIGNEFRWKEELRFHNVTKGRMTDAQFEYWYNVERHNHESSDFYNREREIKKIHWWKDDVFQMLVDAGICISNKTEH